MNIHISKMSVYFGDSSHLSCVYTSCALYMMAVFVQDIVWQWWKFKICIYWRLNYGKNLSFWFENQMCLFFRRFSDSRTNEFEKSIISTQAYHHLDAGCLKLERPIFRRENGWQLIIQKLEQWAILIFMHWISTIIAGEK